jgi:Ni,Fe-hydrogenase III small subunit
MNLKLWALTKSLWVFHAACSPCNNCDIEVLDLLTPRYDVERFGIALVSSIRHADILLVTGVPNYKTRERLKRIYSQAPQPCLVVAVGNCACGRVMFKDSYNSPCAEIMFGIDEIKQRLKDKISDWHEHNPQRIYFTINKKDIREVASILFKDLGLRFATATGVDVPGGFEILYHFSLDKSGQIISVRIFIEDKYNPEIDSLAVISPCFEWIEREIWEMLGIKFVGHPNLKHLLLKEDWPEGNYPLRCKREP